MRPSRTVYPTTESLEQNTNRSIPAASAASSTV